MPMCSGSGAGGGGAAVAWGAADATVVDDAGFGSTRGSFTTADFAATGATDGAGESAVLSAGGGERTTGAGIDTTGESGSARGKDAVAGTPAVGGERPPKTTNPATIAATPSTPAMA